MPGICRIFFGLPSSGKGYTAQNRDWSGFYGSSKYTKIANEDLDYNFLTYSEIGYNLVIIWNPAWIEDEAGLNAMISDAQDNGYSIEKEYFSNDTTQSSCNAYSRWAKKGDTKYYEYINEFITTKSRTYDELIISASASLGFEDGGGINTTPVVPLDKGSCKGGAGELFPGDGIICGLRGCG